jgi:hypothetical protein
MSDPVTYSFYGTTVPVLRNIFTSVTTVLKSAKDERAKAADGKTLPADQEILASKFGEMLPFVIQPALMTKFSIQAFLHPLRLRHPGRDHRVLREAARRA